MGTPHRPRSRRGGERAAPTRLTSPLGAQSPMEEAPQEVRNSFTSATQHQRVKWTLVELRHGAIHQNVDASGDSACWPTRCHDAGCTTVLITIFDSSHRH